MEKNFVFLSEILLRIRWNARCVTWDNFTGKPVDGHMADRTVGMKELGATLRKAQKAAEKLGYGLLLWDGYRPQCAMDCFLNWVSLPEGNLARRRYYPNTERKEMVTKRYAASQPSHSRGSAIDLTTFRLGTGMFVSMGGGFDFVDVRPYHVASGLNEEETSNREGLRAIMERGRFEVCHYEWWHYILVDEPYPGTYFDSCVA